MVKLRKRADATIIVGMLAAIVGWSTVLVPGMWRLVTAACTTVLCGLALVLAIRRYQRQDRGSVQEPQ